MEKKYRILMAQFTSKAGERCFIPYGEGFGVDDLSEYKHRFKEQSGCTELLLTYEEKITNN